MWNCLRMKGRIIKVAKMDGKVLEYRAPMKVHEVVSEFMGHGVSTTLPVSQYLPLTTELTGGNVYYLIPLGPLPNRSPKVSKKVVRFSTPEPEVENPRKSTAIRIKLVISKHELKELIENGVIPVDRITSELGKKDDGNKVYDDSVRKRAWEPVLNSIPETV